MWVSLLLLLGTMALCIVILRRRTLPSGIVGFVHPTSGGGGGGERVLWLMILAVMDHDVAHGIQRRYVLYTKSYPSTEARGSVESLLHLVAGQFEVTLPRPLEVAVLSTWWMQWLEPTKYPRFTLLLHSVGSAIAVFLTVAVMHRCAPIIYETVGIPFSYPLFSLCGVRTCAYVHYPVISTDMIRRVARRESQFNNTSVIASSRLLSSLKLLYYRAFAILYRLVGWCPYEVYTNSSWTDGHIRELWKRQTTVLYPPCNIKHLLSEKPTAQRKPWIVSVGQFRPEKNHVLLIKAFAKVRRGGTLPHGCDARLILIGGARNRDDLHRVEMLKALAADLNVSAFVDFRVSCPFSELRQIVAESLIGLHGMTDEHFGIGVVEYLAAGCIPVAHNSGGVRLDIVRDSFGRLATTLDEFAAALEELLVMQHNSPQTLDAMRCRGQAHAWRFADDRFAATFCATTAACNTTS